MNKTIKTKWFFLFLFVGLMYISAAFFFVESDNENIFPRSHQKDGGKAFLDFLRLKGYKLTESYEPLSDALPELSFRNRNTNKPQLLVLPERIKSSPLRLSEIKPVLDFLARGNSILLFTEYPQRFIDRLQDGYRQENTAEQQHRARKDPAVRMAETIRQLVQEFRSEPTVVEVTNGKQRERKMQSWIVTCRIEAAGKRRYILAGEPAYLTTEAVKQRFRQLSYCSSDEGLVAVSYSAYGGVLYFAATGSLLQNRYIAESANIDFLVDLMQADLYAEILWSEFHNNILLETNLMGRLLSSWQGRLLLFITVFLLFMSFWQSLQIRRYHYRKQREALSLRSLVYPAELLRRFSRKKIKKYLLKQKGGWVNRDAIKN